MLTKLPILASYAYLRDQKSGMIDKVFSRSDVEILLDCGAFTIANTGQRPIKIADYIEFVNHYKSRLFGYMALDKLGDSKVTQLNMRVMLDAGLSPVPVHVLGDNEQRMDELFEISDWVALGGLRRPHRGPAPLSYVKAKMKWAKGRSVHWLGYTRAESIVAWKPYSCDCSNFTAGSRWGLYEVYLGMGKWQRMEHESKGSRGSGSVSSATMPFATNVLAKLESWGFDPDEVLKCDKWRGSSTGGNVVAKTVQDRRMAAIPAFSFVEYSLDVRKRFGTRFFLAASPEQAVGVYIALDHIRKMNA